MKINLMFLRSSMVGGLLLFASIAAAQDALPGDPGYEARIRAEEQRLERAGDPEERARIHLERSNARVREMEVLATRNRHEEQERLAREYSASMEAGLSEMNRAYSGGRNIDDLAGEFERSAARNTETLRRVMENAPEQARPGLTRAMEASQRGRENAQANRGRAQLSTPQQRRAAEAAAAQNQNQNRNQSDIRNQEREVEREGIRGPAQRAPQTQPPAGRGGAGGAGQPQRGGGRN